MAATKEKLRGGSTRLVAYEANQWISQLFVKGKGRIDDDDYSLFLISYET